ncbi:MAG: prepilin-type N-terminal cleavage/methylation domain-containing protein [Patescibacteria group bacterium]
MRTTKKFNLGFTLIEVLVYIALLSILLSGALAVTYQVLQSSESVQAKTTIDEESDFIFHKFDWALNNSTINSPVAGTADPILSLNKAGFAQNPIVFDLNSGNIRIKRGTQTANELNSVNIKITNLLFTHIAPSTGKPAAIHLSFTANGRLYEKTRYLRK